VRAYSRTLWWLVGITWLAAAARFHALFANRFHADEALFASWARLIAVWRDPLLQTQAVDKPPLLFYLQAMAYPLFGPVEWAARLPGLVASLLAIPLTAVLAWRISGQRAAAVVAALFLALMPLAIQFSATAFLDPVMAVLLLAACVFVRRPATAGLCFGLAIATKYQAWLFFPLIAALYRAEGWRSQAWLRWMAGFAPIVILLLGWTAARPGDVNLWSQQMVNFGGVRLAWSWELWPRLLAWTRLWVLALGPPFVITTLVLVAAILWIASDKPIARWLLLFLLAYGLLHWLLAVPVWDRYLLPLMPFVAVLAGVGMGGLWAMRSGRGRRIVIGIAAGIVLLQIPWVSSARSGALPLGGQPAADQGAAEVGQYLADAPYGTVLYDHWYSWHWRYHFFDRGVYVSWFPNAQALVEELRVFHRATADDGAARYVVLPATAVARPVIRAVEDAGFQLIPVYRASQMILYQVEDGRS
jgi:4-amino-4-deoxy-L-arabinose transferase-like glycosyltransferase